MHNSVRRFTAVSAVCAWAAIGWSQAMTSPPAKAEASLGGKPVVIKYAQPSVRGRKIMGDLVPYGSVWRTGANSATELKTDTGLMIGDLKVPAGTYTLYTLPGADSWKLIVNKQTGQWGTEYDEKQDLGRTTMKVSKTPSVVERFTIRFDNSSQSSANLVMEWENTRVSVPVKANG